MNVFLHESEFMKACMDVSKKCIKNFPPIQVYFWRLPAQFTGNQLGSYGGFLNFSLRTIPAYSITEGALVILKVCNIHTKYCNC